MNTNKLIGNWLQENFKEFKWKQVIAHAETTYFQSTTRPRWYIDIVNNFILLTEEFYPSGEQVVLTVDLHDPNSLTILESRLKLVAERTIPI